VRTTTNQEDKRTILKSLYFYTIALLLLKRTFFQKRISANRNAYETA